MESPHKKLMIISQRTESDEQKAVLYLKELRQVEISPSYLTDHENYPTLATLKNQIGINLTFKIITAMILDFVKSINVTLPSDGQIFEMSKELIRDYPTYKPEDFKLFFDNAKKGKYGEMYNRFDISVLYKWLSEFEYERNEKFEELLQQRKNELYAQPAIRSNDVSVMKDLYKKAIEKGEKEFEEKKYAELRKRAIAKWKLDYDLHFTGVTITEELHNAYSENNPLNEQYIETFINNQK